VGRVRKGSICSTKGVPKVQRDVRTPRVKRERKEGRKTTHFRLPRTEFFLKKKERKDINDSTNDYQSIAKLMTVEELNEKEHTIVEEEKLYVSFIYFSSPCYHPSSFLLPSSTNLELELL